MARPKGREKNQLFRLFFLDQCLRDRNQDYSRKELIENCNEWLKDNELIEEEDDIGRRTIETDLELMGWTKTGKESKSKSFNKIFPDSAIEEHLVQDPKTGKSKRAIRYADPDYSLFERKLSAGERSLILSLIRTMGRFKHLPGMERLASLEEKLREETTGPDDFRTLVDLGFTDVKEGSVNPMSFFEYIDRRKTCLLFFRPPKPGPVKKILVSPYQIRQYNGNWFLVAHDHKDREIGTFSIFAVNRIERISDPAQEGYDDLYINFPGRIEDRFKDVIGVTVEESSPLKEVVMAAKPDRFYFWAANPFHPSFRRREDVDEDPAVPDGWIYFSVQCRINQEFYSKLLSFGNDIIILTPSSVRKTYLSKIQKINKLYFQ